ncbi:methyltransferase-domain-containing protein [Hypoxylon rubiginosum]|uniref:Methyltransferase-domain-containing protein n=1 Tax=Hypoxylon rubiginosum TaxID=110542 RepID=A0ACC0D5H2_9PEZI|nr:methyltransferase-domain-containing protein [Hypoxylon rubiginosum]
MFAVPGWSVSADSLKPETAKGAKGAPKATQPAQDESDNSKKRKRPSSGPNVTTSNVADLWERVIEGRSGKKARPSDEAGPNGKPRPEGMRKLMTLKEKKKLKKLREKEESERNGTNKTEPAAAETPDPAAPPKEEKKNKKRKPKDRKDTDDNKQPEENEKAAPAKPSKVPAAPPAPAAPKLTPMQAQMREKLVSARFRHLNETLYTKPSADAFQLFADAPEMFQEYHEGFRRQVDVWPENPVDGYIEDLKQRGRQRAPQKSKHGHSSSAPGAVVSLPRTNHTCTVADLGCGDAKLASALQADKKKLKLEVLSYDLQSPSPLVTKADIANLPLEDGSVNVVVFCLALMGTNWLDFVEEAYRVLHWKGELWVAEIKSRFGPAGGKNGKKGGGGGGAVVVAHSVGNRRKTGAAGKKGKGGKDAEAADGESHEAELAVEVDGADDKREETDVSAFVEALRKRGFVLQGEADLKNKMFVKMHFLKAAPPSVGKGAVAPAKESTSRANGPRKNGIKFIDAKEEQSTQDEASILKPCVYKLR